MRNGGRYKYTPRLLQDKHVATDICCTDHSGLYVCVLLRCVVVVLARAEQGASSPDLKGKVSRDEFSSVAMHFFWNSESDWSPAQTIILFLAFRGSSGCIRLAC